jgi:hypothetical protein
MQISAEESNLGDLLFLYLLVLEHEEVRSM